MVAMDETRQHAPTDRVAEARAVLEDRIRILGPDHPDTLKVRDGLAASLNEAGRAQEAIDELRAVLEDRIRVLGPDHPDTVKTRDSLEIWREQAGSSTP